MVEVDLTFLEKIILDGIRAGMDDFYYKSKEVYTTSLKRNQNHSNRSALV